MAHNGQTYASQCIDSSWIQCMTIHWCLKISVMTKLLIDSTVSLSRNGERYSMATIHTNNSGMKNGIKGLWFKHDEPDREVDTDTMVVYQSIKDGLPSDIGPVIVEFHDSADRDAFMHSEAKETIADYLNGKTPEEYHFEALN